MSSKSARRRRRERQQRREEAAFEPELEPQDIACADSDVSHIDGLLDEGLDVLHDLLAAAVSSRRAWPVDEDTVELREILEATHKAAVECSSKLVAIRDRIAEFRSADCHLHVSRGHVLRLVPASLTPDSADDIPF